MVADIAIDQDDLAVDEIVVLSPRQAIELVAGDRRIGMDVEIVRNDERRQLRTRRHLSGDVVIVVLGEPSSRLTLGHGAQLIAAWVGDHRPDTKFHHRSRSSMRASLPAV